MDLQTHTFQTLVVRLLSAILYALCHDADEMDYQVWKDRSDLVDLAQEFTRITMQAEIKRPGESAGE